MHKGIATASLITLVALAGCKKHDAPAVDTAAPATAPTAAAPTPAPTPPAEDTASAPVSEAQGKLDFATMEDGYMNDPDAQWATSAKASSSFSEADKLPPDAHESNTPWQATGSINGNGWTNNRQDIGFDWIQLDYDRPVSANAVRAVFNDTAVAAVTKVEVIGVDGAAHTVWSGISDTKPETRGARSWFVRKFDPTPYPVKSVKLTFANNVASGYKDVDAVQLVGK